ncbi:unnamed protein product [Prunus armeniaca]
MTFDPDDFLNTTQPRRTYITNANDVTYPVTGADTVALSSSLTLSNTLLVPSLSNKLLSDIHTKEILGLGTKRGGLYYVDDFSPGMANSVTHPFDSKQKQIWLWHRRLGHPSFSYMKHLIPDLFSSFKDSNFTCDTCILAKSHRVPYPLSTNKCTTPFTLIHSDVWGPSPITAPSGSFHKQMKTQFNAHIQILRSDNGGEFVNHDFQTYFQQHEIIHETTCPQTPQQNGVAERKNRHLLETARALLIGAHVPRHHWDDAIVTAVHLINRMPSGVLTFKIPLQVLAQHRPLPSVLVLTPRIFGCVAFVHLHKNQRSKLDPCALRCVFVGYATHQKGYRCYHPPTRRTYVTLDVTFLESELFFHDPSSNSTLQEEIRNEEQNWSNLENEEILLYNTEQQDEDPPLTQQYQQTNLLRTSLRQNRGKPPNRYSPDIGKTSKYPIANHVSTEKLSEPLKAFVHQLSAIHIPTKMDLSSDTRQDLWQKANLDWPLHQFDVKNAFLHGKLTEEVYMDIPSGYNTTQTGTVCRLRKALYGLKQSPRAWFGRFTMAMKNNGFKQCNSDHTLFLKHRKRKEISQLQDYLATEFEMKDLGGLKKYVLDLLTDTGMLDCKPADTPIVQNHHLGEYPDQVPTNKERYQIECCQSIYALSSEDHMNAVLRILRYLKSAPGKGLMFSKLGHLNIDGYSDADWAGNVTDRKSTSGYFTFVGGNLVTWRSKKQNVVALSSAEAEFRGITKGICELLWLRKLLTELGYKPTSTMNLFCDNRAAIAIAQNPVQHDRTKHVEVDRHFIKQKLEAKVFQFPFVKSEDQLADILTKAISSKVFHNSLDQLGIGDIYAPT